VGSLEGTIAWVTGAGSGIGRAIAQALADAGAQVAASGRRAEPLEETAAGRSGILPLPCDMTDPAAIQAVAATIADRLGPVGLQVNNAGINASNRAWSTLTPDTVRLIIEGNLSSVFLANLAVLPSMRARGSGLIVTIASMAGLRPHPGAGSAYAAAKAGVIAASQVLNAEEGVHGIRASAVCPGDTATPILDRRPKPPGPEARERMLQPEDVAEAVLFLARLHPRAHVPLLAIEPTWNRYHRQSLEPPRDD
jgi:NAD(P)-dependent dehydrogenase (short-subunit alcohol dehydrogenase family)